MIRSLGFGFLFVYAMRMAAVFMIVVSTIGMRLAVFPRWLVVAGYLAALALMLNLSYNQLLVLVFPACSRVGGHGQRRHPHEQRSPSMNLLLAAVILVVVDALAIGALLWVRRGAPDGSYFADGDRASGVFGVLATGFAIFAGFVIFLAFTSYDESRSGAESEALAVIQQFETAQSLPAASVSAVGLRQVARPDVRT